MTTPPALTKREEYYYALGALQGHFCINTTEQVSYLINKLKELGQSISTPISGITINTPCTPPTPIPCSPVKDTPWPSPQDYKLTCISSSQKDDNITVHF